MFYVYFIQSQVDKNWLYVGHTNNLDERICKHNAGKVKSTKFKRPFVLVYCEKFNNKSEAAKREYQIKHNNQQKEIIKKKINNNQINL